MEEKMAPLYCKSFLASAFTLEGRNKTNKNHRQVVTSKIKFFGCPRYLHVICKAKGKLK